LWIQGKKQGLEKNFRRQGQPKTPLPGLDGLWSQGQVFMDSIHGIYPIQM